MAPIIAPQDTMGMMDGGSSTPSPKPTIPASTGSGELKGNCPQCGADYTIHIDFPTPINPGVGLNPTP